MLTSIGIEASSLGTPGARELRARSTDDQVRPLRLLDVVPHEGTVEGTVEGPAEPLAEPLGGAGWYNP